MQQWPNRTVYSAANPKLGLTQIAAAYTTGGLYALSTIESISALTLATRDMARAVAFYESLGLEIVHGGAVSDFTSFRAGSGYVNLTFNIEREWSWWGRAVFYVSDVDAMYQLALAAGLKCDTKPRDAQWRERYFHITDPDGHELSFARSLARSGP
jgi:catechol 2,3-dioxygenase-like lactoylglutathione lyase family enzyme